MEFILDLDERNMKTVSNLVSAERYDFPDSVRSFLPKFAVIPLRKAGDENFTCIVHENDMVTEGQIVGFSLKEGSTHKTYVHASVAGRIVSIGKCMLPDGTEGEGLKIRMEGAFSYLGKELRPVEWQWNSPELLLSTIEEKGIVNTFGKPKDLALQISECKISRGRFIVVRLYDDDPSHVTDSFVAKNHTEQVIEGIHILSLVLKTQGIVLLMQKKSALEIKDDEFGNIPVFKMEVDNRKYPSGLVQNIVEMVKNAPKEAGQEIFNDISEFGLFVDPETLFTLYEGVVLGKPVLESFVHVSGNSIRGAAMLKVRVGTSIRSIVEQCGGFVVPPAKIIVNGIIMGAEVKSLETSITKSVKSVSFVPARNLSDDKSSPCIRCGKCRTLCPEGIYPDLMYRHSIGGKQVGSDMLASAMLCSGCGLCNSVCPSRLPLSQTIEQLRNKNEVK